MDPKVIVDVGLSDGKMLTVEQPVDGLTNMVLENYEGLVQELEYEVDVLQASLLDDYETALTDPVENIFLGIKALQLSTKEENPERVALYHQIATAAAKLSLSHY